MSQAARACCSARAPHGASQDVSIVTSTANAIDRRLPPLQHVCIHDARLVRQRVASSSPLSPLHLSVWPRR